MWVGVQEGSGSGGVCWGGGDFWGTGIPMEVLRWARGFGGSHNAWVSVHGGLAIVGIDLSRTEFPFLRFTINGWPNGLFIEGEDLMCKLPLSWIALGMIFRRVRLNSITPGVRLGLAFAFCWVACGFLLLFARYRWLYSCARFGSDTSWMLGFTNPREARCEAGG